MNFDLFESSVKTQKERLKNALKEIPPHKPGVYSMYDEKDNVIYVGKAKNLFQRLSSYKYSKSTKVQQMIAHLYRVGIEVCENETDAILLENLLIRSLRPPFNEVNKKSDTYYISTTRKGNKRELRLSINMLSDYSLVYGSFKGHNRVRKGVGALLKLLYMINNEIDSAYFLPAKLLNRITPMSFSISLNDDIESLMDNFLKGIDSELLRIFEHKINQGSFNDIFTQKYFLNEYNNLQLFYELGPLRNHLIKEELNLQSELILQEELDDMQVLYMERQRHKN